MKKIRKNFNNLEGKNGAMRVDPNKPLEM